MATITMHSKTSEADLAHHLSRFKAHPSAEFITKLNAMNAAAATTIGAAAAIATATSLSWAAKTSVAGLSSALTFMGGSKGAVIVVMLGVGLSVAATQHDAVPRQVNTEVAHAMSPNPQEPETRTVSDGKRSTAKSGRVRAPMPALAIDPEKPTDVALPSEVLPNSTEELGPTQRVEAPPEHAPRPRSRPVSTLSDEQQLSYKETVDRWRSGLEKCQVQARAAGSRQISGTVEVELVIGNNGLAQNVDVDSSTVRDPELLECVERGIGRWQFVRRDEFVVLSFELHFAP